MYWLSERDICRIREVPHFRESHYANYDLNRLMGSYVSDFAQQLGKFSYRKPVRKIADIGTGYGWLAIAFARTGKFDVVAVDTDAARLKAAQAIADILEVGDRIEWFVSSVERLPFSDREIDATYCVEVIEHVGDTPSIVADLARVTNDLLIVTTPNKMSPIINHDTGLPMCHWLPPGRLRDLYASPFGRSAEQANNRFWTSGKFSSGIPGL